MEPLLDKYYFHTPYHYCRNNPVSRSDGNGFHDGSAGHVMLANDMAQAGIHANEYAQNSFTKSLIIGSGALGAFSGGLMIGAGYSLASSSVSITGSLGGAGLVVSGLYSTIASPIKAIGSLTDNEELKGLATTYTGTLLKGVDAAIGDGSNDFEVAGNILQNFVSVGYDYLAGSGVLAKTIDIEQLSESIIEAAPFSSNTSAVKNDTSKKSNKRTNPMQTKTQINVTPGRSSGSFQGTYEGRNAL